MASGKALFGSLFGKLLFRDATVRKATELSAHFRRVDLAGKSLENVAWEPGDKVQVYLADAGMRTYTPLSWDPLRGLTSLLVYVHGTQSPGAAWGHRLREGSAVQFFGPRGSVALRSLSARGPLVFFGDETSYAAAYALRTSGAKGPHAYVFEGTTRAESLAVLEGLGLEGASLIERGPGDGHLREAGDALLTALRARPDAGLVLTGKAQSIQALRARLKSEGMARDGKVKAYWSVGKTGLD